MLEPRYDPKAAENRWYAFWQEKNYFHGQADDSREPYSIVIPPPNVTGSLHMGHALNNTLQDILARWKRMKGYNVCWMPGMDHAGIATQNVVERQLADEGLRREDLGREEFVKRVWGWKAESGGTIIHQLKKLGASCDWERERFTMDEGLSQAVRESFVRLYEEGLIYQGNYLVNWCPRCTTAVSDLEVEYEDRDGHMWDFHYPLWEGGHGLTISTTRPETMLGDTAVAVHPDDERHKHLVGKMLRLPLLDRKIPVIADTFVDPEFGTGAVKVTPAHDPNDYEAGLRNELPQINILNTDGSINENGGPYEGMDRYEARARIVEDLENLGLMRQVKPHSHSVGTCYRCATPIEPFLSKQWFVNTKPLAEEAIRAVKDGRIRIVPKQWESTYFEWMENIRDWCISRQIWWGHQIPAWHNDKTGEIVVSREDPDDPNLRRETDVLDTWFSSALWPFSTFGWPEKNADLDYFYPTSVLVTGFDIIFFWVARMIMSGLKFMDEVPFRDVYIHALVRDEHGQKMSKTRGNVIDPLDIIEEFGTDSLRLTLTAMAAQGRDIRLSTERIAGFRNFCNKLWNAARFTLMNIGETLPDMPPHETLSLGDRWILSRLNEVTRKTDLALEEYRFNDAALALYQFTWHELCDWYIEVIKPALMSESGGEASKAVLGRVLERTLRLLHPIMPYISEEIWQKLPGREGESIMIANWPEPEPEWDDPGAESDFELLTGILGSIRNIRGELNIPPNKEISASIRVGAENEKKLIENEFEWFLRLGKIGTDIVIGSDIEQPEASASAVYGNIASFVPIKGLIDLDEEIQRLDKQIKDIAKSIGGIEKKLANPKFVDRAPEEVVQKNRDAIEEERGREQKLQESLSRLMELKS
ncbi:MAG: valine--tRNA ligase [Nitrospinaceae bacterium]|nr:valine--tRNA ligase [Nitrospinaceae bacterium]MBT3434579.1 valine--tRNA ligase [Nitrospinaceae bacterium]MBT3822824.1 valine--tRNA ligase [Nitrospinaceae bacterium]MBT5367065.1 valine--tRNA ligase [Nitrospinaceae bacterium]MBT5948882.1 valine--tRNA ligase [Nitrospinaceae bacterium]